MKTDVLIFWKEKYGLFGLSDDKKLHPVIWGTFSDCVKWLLYRAVRNSISAVITNISCCSQLEQIDSIKNVVVCDTYTMLLSSVLENGVSAPANFLIFDDWSKECQMASDSPELIMGTVTSTMFSISKKVYGLPISDHQLINRSILHYCEWISEKALGYSLSDAAILGDKQEDGELPLFFKALEPDDPFMFQAPDPQKFLLMMNDAKKQYSIEYLLGCLQHICEMYLRSLLSTALFTRKDCYYYGNVQLTESYFQDNRKAQKGNLLNFDTTPAGLAKGLYLYYEQIYS